jgi:hypothetical protein
VAGREQELMDEIADLNHITFSPPLRMDLVKAIYHEKVSSSLHPSVFSPSLTARSSTARGCILSSFYVRCDSTSDSPLLPAGSMLCAQHALNNLLQSSMFTAQDLAEVARGLDALEAAQLDPGTAPGESPNYDDSGFFSIMGA